MKKAIITYLLVACFVNLQAQVTIAGGDVTSCNQVIYDSGNVGGTGYSNNESYTITICPDDPTKTIKLNFQSFNLDPTNTAPNGQPSNADYISVFDGDNVGGTSLGTYVENQLNGVLVGTTSSNTTGCITLVFESNDIGTGNFTILATCQTPCKPPIAAATSAPDTVAKICKNEMVSFDASTSFAQPGFNLDMYYWDYDDGLGEDSVSGVTTSYTFNEVGAYRIKLRVRDDNPDTRCFNTNAVEMVVLVAPDPVFDPMSISGTACLGEPINLSANPGSYDQEWTGVPYSNFGGAQYIPDQVGSCFTSTLDFGVFNPGQQLNNVNDLLGINMNFEHSFMGDLQISIICPNNISVTLHDQGGSGTLLGIPVDPGPGPGTGFDYTWSPTATNGTWAGNSAGNNTLPAGTYESLNPLSGLIGCDLNGVWQIEVCDLLGSDDGYIFSWGIDFNPALLPGLTHFKPETGIQADSSFWAPYPSATISTDGNNLSVTPSAAGSHSFNYTMINDHGCQKDTTVIVVITPNPVTSVGPNTNDVACLNADFQLSGSVSPNPGAVVYSWSPITGLSDPNISNPIASISTDMVYTLRAFRTGHPLCFTEDQLSLTVSAPPPAGIDFQAQYCQTDPAVNMFSLLGVGATPNGVWTDTTSNTVVNSLFNPAMQPSGVYQYEVVDADGCRDTAIVTLDVALPFVLNQSNDTLICENGTAVIGVNPTGGFGGPFVETWNQGLVGNGVHSINPLVDECYDVFVLDANGCVSPTETICVTLNPALQLTNSGNTSICINTNTLLDALIVSGGNGSYNYEWSDGTNTIASTSEVSVSPIVLTQYCLTMSDNCESTPVTECLEVDLFEQPEAVFSADKVDGCFPIQVTFTNETTPHLINSVIWSFGNGSLSDALGDVTTVYGAPIPYNVKLTVTSADGCIDDTLMVNYVYPFDYPVAEFNMSPNPTTFFDTNIEMENLSSEDVSINKWNFGIEANPPISDLEELMVHFPTEKTGIYPVTLVVTNDEGCLDSITHDLIINSVFTLYVPNAFSPNKDDVNETFSASGESVSDEEFLLRIFNRSGGIVFETTDITEEWNGNSKSGIECPMGVYVWKIQAKDIYTDEIKESYGYVSLIR